MMNKEKLKEEKDQFKFDYVCIQNWVNFILIILVCIGGITISIFFNFDKNPIFSIILIVGSMVLLCILTKILLTRISRLRKASENVGSTHNKLIGKQK